jgi:hypothetical protein
MRGVRSVVLPIVLSSLWQAFRINETRFGKEALNLKRIFSDIVRAF